MTAVGCQSAMPIRSASSDVALRPEVANPSAFPDRVETEEPAETVRQAGHEQPAPVAPSSEQPRPLTLTDLETIAFQNHPTLAAAIARMESARGKQLQAGLYPNPAVGYQAAEVGNDGTAGQQGGFVSQRFITAGKLELDQAVAAKSVDEAHFRLHGQEQRILSDVRMRFYEALVMQRRVRLTEELVEIGEKLKQSTGTLLKAGQATENDLLQAEIRAENALILHDNALNEHTEAWRRLAAVCGVTDLAVSPLGGDLEANLADYDWSTCYQSVLAAHPEISAAQARVERAAFAVQRARREPIPNIDLMVGLRHHYGTGSDIANVQLGVPIPVYDRNQGNIRSAEADWIAASRDVERIQLDLQDRFAVTFRRYQNARQQVERYSERILPRARRSLELVTNGYGQGQVDYLTLLTAQQTYVEASLSHLNAVRELRVASAIIDGQLLTDSLTARN